MLKNDLCCRCRRADVRQSWHKIVYYRLAQAKRIGASDNCKAGSEGIQVLQTELWTRPRVALPEPIQKHSEIWASNIIRARRGGVVLSPPRVGGQTSLTEAALMAFASERGTVELVNICRRMREFWEETYDNAAKGSFRYWAGNPMVFGINTSGQLANAPNGQLDVWLRTDRLAEVSGVPETVIKERFSKDFSPFDAGRMDFVIRLKSKKEAEALVAHLRELVAEQGKSAATA
jgi:hypothetical protein